MAREARAVESVLRAGKQQGEDAAEMEARGRMLTEYGDLRRRLAGLMAEASAIAAEYQELSNQLRLCPNVVSIEGLITPNSSKPVFSQSLFDTDRLGALVGEIRSTIERKNEIQDRLHDIGILDAYGQFRY
jgi:hypothetical protein